MTENAEKGLGRSMPKVGRMEVRDKNGTLRFSRPEQGTLKTCQIQAGQPHYPHMQVVKYLGVFIDSKLFSKDHIRNICEKARKTFGKLTAICANTYGYSNETRRTMIDGTIGAYFGYAALCVPTA